MSKVVFQRQVEDSVPKINDEVAVGEDLDFSGPGGSSSVLSGSYLRF